MKKWILTCFIILRSQNIIPMVSTLELHSICFSRRRPIQTSTDIWPSFLPPKKQNLLKLLWQRSGFYCRRWSDRKLLFALYCYTCDGAVSIVDQCFSFTIFVDLGNSFGLNFSIRCADESFFAVDNRVGVFRNISFIGRNNFHFRKAVLLLVFVFIKIGTQFFSRRKGFFPNHSSKIIVEEMLLRCWIVSFVKTYFFWDLEFVV